MSVKYIFCISTGRCGTEYLSKLFSCLHDCKSYHEQEPRMHKELMREFLAGNPSMLENKINDKINIILSENCKLYCDTSHIFIKSFGWEIPNYLPQEEIGVIILRRDKKEVVESTHRVQSGPFNDLGRDWIIFPNGNNLIKPPIGKVAYNYIRYMLKIYWRIIKAGGGYKKYPKLFKKLSILLIGWYYDETYALGEKYKQTFPDITYVDITLDRLNTSDGFKELLKYLGLDTMLDEAALQKMIGNPINLKTNYIEQ